MIEIVSEYLLKGEARQRFELTYGPGGEWSNLFAASPGFRGMTILRDTQDPRRYLTIEVWDAQEQRQQALTEQATEATDLEAKLNDWIESRRELGIYGVLAQAGVRPRAKAGRTSRRSLR